MNDMQGRLDSMIDVAAALVMALAGGWSMLMLFPDLGLAATGGAALLVFAMTHAVMRLVGRPLVLGRVKPHPIAPLPFDEEAWAGDARDEAAPPPVIPAEDEPLVLDDILAEMAPSSRVVRLFAPEEVPTAGELKERIDRHLEGPEERIERPTPVELPDASERLAAAMGRARMERD
ncbi:hypothetical protein [Sphingomicrobium lutaoense]|uniref:Uncharacterized protein n=1 Tax=Sphingomicrobium lutaoense TaxID=515949 RepID=A0A839Z025_9SPHN|nr:hypothetical protein [Sphingomicrobium lutaoense]MBB3763387.1 hypothetical protein [Sphingomicrobium lutaoense]